MNDKDREAEEITTLLLNALEQQDIALVRDAISQGADITIHGNYAMEYAIRQRNEKLAQTLLEERFTALINSNPVLTLLTILLSNNKHFIKLANNHFQCPKTILYAFHHCTPKTATESTNTVLIDRLVKNTSLNTLYQTKQELKEVLKKSTRYLPRHQIALTILDNNIAKKRRIKMIEKLSSNSLEPQKNLYL